MSNHRYELAIWFLARLTVGHLGNEVVPAGMTESCSMFSVTKHNIQSQAPLEVRWSRLWEAAWPELRLMIYIFMYILPEGYVAMEAALYRQLITGKLNMF